MTNLFVLNEIITGSVLGIGILWILVPFRSVVLPNRKWADIVIAIMLVLLITTVQSGYVAGLATYASIVTTLGLRVWARLALRPIRQPKRTGWRPVTW